MTAVSLETEKENQGQEKQAIPSPQKEGTYGGGWNQWKLSCIVCDCLDIDRVLTRTKWSFLVEGTKNLLGMTSMGLQNRMLPPHDANRLPTLCNYWTEAGKHKGHLQEKRGCIYVTNKMLITIGQEISQSQWKHEDDLLFLNLIMGIAVWVSEDLLHAFYPKLT